MNNEEQKNLEAELDWRINKIGEDHLWKKITGKVYVSDKEYKYLAKKIDKILDKRLRPYKIIGISFYILFFIGMALVLLNLTNII